VEYLRQARVVGPLPDRGTVEAEAAKARTTRQGPDYGTGYGDAAKYAFDAELNAVPRPFKVDPPALGGKLPKSSLLSNAASNGETKHVDARHEGNFNYDIGWGQEPKPAICAIAEKLKNTLGTAAMEASTYHWHFESFLRSVRLASTPAEKSRAVDRLEAVVALHSARLPLTETEIEAFIGAFKSRVSFIGKDAEIGPHGLPIK
jgi:hypothetical protein